MTLGSATTGLGLRAIKGGAVAVAVVVEGGEPRLLFSTFLATHDEGDRLSLEPYAVAYELRQGASPDAAAMVEDGRRRQDRCALAGLGALVARIEGSVKVGLLVNRAGWVTDLLDYSLAFPEHVPVAEGLAVREALRSACRTIGIEATELDEKSLPATAADLVNLSPEAIDAQIKALGIVAGKPWRKEQKLACLAAWVAAS